jgi:hypothetical protein
VKATAQAAQDNESGDLQSARPMSTRANHVSLKMEEGDSEKIQCNMPASLQLPMLQDDRRVQGRLKDQLQKKKKQKTLRQ